jgi:hypothetical protein
VKNSSSNHPAQTDRVTSAPNCNLSCGQKEPNTTHKPVRPHQSSHLHANTRIGYLGVTPELYQTELFVEPGGSLSYFINFVITIFLNLLLPPSLSFLFLCYNPLFSLPTTLCAPSHPLNPVFTSPCYPSPTYHYTTPPFYKLNTHWLPYCTNCTQLQTPAIPDTSILHYNNRNTHKHIKCHKTQQPPYLFPHPPTPFPASPV